MEGWRDAVRDEDGGQRDGVRDEDGPDGVMLLLDVGRRDVMIFVMRMEDGVTLLPLSSQLEMKMGDGVTLFLLTPDVVGRIAVVAVAVSVAVAVAPLLLLNLCRCCC